MAYLITWTCYGTRVHGDDRGTVDDTHNRFGTPFLSPDDTRQDEVRSTLKELPWEMGPLDRDDVQRAILKTAEYRKWRVLSLNVRTNHVHVVIGAPKHPPERVAGDLKAWATRALKASGRFGGRTKFWTNQASTRHLFDDVAVANAVAYVGDQ